MSATPQGRLDISSEGDVVSARQAAREAALALGFGMTDVTRIVTAVSELARNVFMYAGQGEMRWSTIASSSQVGLELVFADQGPGIANTAQALTPGYTTSGGLGMGLPGAKRLMDDLEIKSTLGQGTVVTTRKWRER